MIGKSEVEYNLTFNDFFRIISLSTTTQGTTMQLYNINLVKMTSTVALNVKGFFETMPANTEILHSATGDTPTLIAQDIIKQLKTAFAQKDIGLNGNYYLEMDNLKFFVEQNENDFQGYCISKYVSADDMVICGYFFSKENADIGYMETFVSTLEK